MSKQCKKIVEVPAQADRLHALRSLVREHAAEFGFSAACVEDIVLAVNEACMNIIQHGYSHTTGNIELVVCSDSDSIEFQLRDEAPTVSLNDWQPRQLDDLRPGGLGVHFIREIMDEVSYLPSAQGAGNLLSLKKYSTSRAASS